MTAEVHACVKQLSDDNDAVLLAGSAPGDQLLQLREPPTRAFDHRAIDIID
jgi:hypothetical protein